MHVKSEIRKKHGFVTKNWVSTLFPKVPIPENEDFASRKPNPES